jgi:endoglucanase
MKTAAHLRALAVVAALALELSCHGTPSPFTFPLSDGGAPSSRFLHARGAGLEDSDGNAVQLRCENLGGWIHPEAWMLAEDTLNLLVSAAEIRSRLASLVGQSSADAFWNQYRSAFVAQADFERLGAMGFNCVRLPLEYEFLLGDNPPPGAPLNPESMATLDSAVSWAQAQGLYVIFDLHTAPGGQNSLSDVSDVPSTDTTPQLFVGPDAQANQALLAALWKNLAAHYANEGSVGGYDLLNEPDVPSSISPTALPYVYANVISQIRQVDPDHLVLVEGDNLAADFSAFPAPLDPNQAYSFHAYASNSQWKSPSPSSLSSLLALRDRDRLPLWLGEFGVNSLSWEQSVVQLMEQNKIGWPLWTWKQRAVEGQPIAESFNPPADWEELLTYLVAPELSETPSDSKAEAALADLLLVVPLASCQEDSTLFHDLVTP